MKKIFVYRDFILVGIVTSRTIDFVVTGCSSDRNDALLVIVCLMSFAGMHLHRMMPIYLLQINNGNAISHTLLVKIIHGHQALKILKEQ